MQIKLQYYSKIYFKWNEIKLVVQMGLFFFACCNVSEICKHWTIQSHSLTASLSCTCIDKFAFNLTEGYWLNGKKLETICNFCNNFFVLVSKLIAFFLLKFHFYEPMAKGKADTNTNYPLFFFVMMIIIDLANIKYMQLFLFGCALTIKHATLAECILIEKKVCKLFSLIPFRSGAAYSPPSVNCCGGRSSSFHHCDQLIIQQS